MSGHRGLAYEAACTGDTFEDVCKDRDCSVCSLWRGAGESKADWYARIRAEFRENPIPKTRRDLRGVA